jgi:SNF2 family DNA or RNA helicase
MIPNEGHKVKNPRTKTAHAAKLVEPDHTIIVTATPMINRVSDLIGYLDLL